MFETIDYRLLFGITAGIVTVVGYLPYLKDIFAGTTKPHLYTWVIWAITQGTATAVLLKGGGAFGSLSLIIGVALVLLVCVLSLHYGTNNITRGDTITLIVALLAVVVWWQLDSPLLALLMVTAIDALGYIPTFRKSYEEPWSETPSFWLIMTTAVVLTIFANGEYNLLTMTYLVMLGVANTLLYMLLLVRRKSIKKPS